jgi:RNA polymerase sigma-70 factor (ECF subfamily)
VLEAIYAAFAQGWAEAFADDPRGRNLAEEAIWLGRVVVALAPEEPEALGLLALMLYADSRRAARRDAEGRYVPLTEQNVAMWNRDAIDDAEALLRAASALARPGRFQLEAAIQSAHASRRRTGAADWDAIAALYEALFALTGSRVVAVNRAIAVANAHGAAAGLQLLEEAEAEGSLEGYQSYWAAKADLQARTGDRAAAATSYNMAIGLETDAATRAFLLERLAALTPDASA